MGIVYLARDIKQDLTVAFECLPSDVSLDEEAEERFIRAKAVSALEQANICTIHEIAESDEGELYIVMVFYRRQTLEDRLTSEHYSVEHACDIALQLARALERALEEGIFHRDLVEALLPDYWVDGGQRARSNEGRVTAYRTPSTIYPLPQSLASLLYLDP